MVIVYWLSINSKKDYDITIYYRVYSIFMEQVGYVNSYGHEVIAIQRYENGKFVSIKNWFEKISEEQKKNFKTRLIDSVINSLEKLKR